MKRDPLAPRLGSPELGEPGKSFPERNLDPGEWPSEGDDFFEELEEPWPHE